MKSKHRLVIEALTILKTIHEDLLEERNAYRNEVHRLTGSGLSLSFANLEHFLDRYGYIQIDQRSDILQLTSSGFEAVRGDESRISSLHDDLLYHFSKELEEGVLSESNSTVNTGKRFDQHYIRFEGIGRGGVGSVWRSEHLKTGRQIAIKTLEGLDEVITSGRKSTLKKRLERNIRQIAQLSHPFICPILDLSVHHTPPYYAMPLYTGGSLREALNSGPMQPEVALNLFAQICLGMQHAHQQGVLHLDLKPENILLDQSGNVRIFDFGMSRTIAKQVAQIGRQSYVGFGSVAYMAPELLRDPQHESKDVDIYALGLILYEMLIGELPGRRSPMPSEVIEGLPQPIDDLFDAMTQDVTQRRPKTMEEVLEKLSEVPPFDRLASQSTVLTFISPPFDLPGLKSVEIPEIEEAHDIQRDAKRHSKETSTLDQMITSFRSITRPNSNESQQREFKIDSLRQKSSAAPIEISESKPTPAGQETESILEGNRTQLEAHHTHDEPKPALSQEVTEALLSLSDEMKTETSSAPSPLQNQIPQNTRQETEEQIFEEIEVLEEIDEALDEVISSATALPQSTTRELIPEPISTEDQGSLSHSLSEDDFTEDAATALHEQVPFSKPHSQQPVPQAQQRHNKIKRSSVSEQLFERQQRNKT